MEHNREGGRQSEGTRRLLESWKNVNSRIAAIGTILILVGLPLIYQDFYFNILDVKYYYYCGVVITMSMAMAVAAIIFCMRDAKENDHQAVRELKRSFSLKKLTGVDWAMIGFVAAATVSTFQSEYFYESFWGNEGRFCGLFLILLYGLCYFIVSKYLRLKKWYVDVFLATGVIVCIVGILHFFNVDPLGFKADISPDDYDIFTSTIGNINTYTSYIALLAGAGAVMFSMEQEIKRKIWYGISFALFICALVMGISDNAYLALFALLGFVPLYLFGSFRGIKNYVIILAMIFTEFWIIGWICNRFSGRVLEISGIFNVISGISGLPVIAAVLWGIAVVLHIVELKRAAAGLDVQCRLMRYIWLILVALGAAVVLFVLYDANMNGNGSRYGGLQSYVVIDNSWGTNRGYIWRLAMRIYDDFPLLHKIFGYGPDTFGILTVNQYYDEMTSLYGQKFESVHNEYLQYLVTMGVTGLAAYVGLLVSSIVRLVKKSGHKPAVMALVFAVLCYGAQAFVNISVPLVAPIMLLLIMAGLADTREAF